METDADEVIELRVGEERTVTLPGLSSAGYQWSVEAVVNDGITTIAKQASEHGSSAAAGASADERFALKALRPGVARLVCRQRRPWETGHAASEHVIELRVND